MTNLDIIKYLAYENPSRLAELLDDIYCTAWNHGSYAAVSKNPFSENEIDDFGEWIDEEVNTNFFYDYELEEWSKIINPTPTLVAFYGTESKVIDQAIDEIELLETLVKEN